jgi:spore coat polysaccharide biosynthesis protein SpsF
MITAIVQARMGSSRLPGKTLLPFGSETLLDYVISRISHSRYIEQVVVATTNEPEDDVIAEHCADKNILYYRGSSSDVLRRFVEAAYKFNATHIVRVTADDPFKTAEVIDTAFEKYFEDSLDYCSNTLEPTYPEGLDIEVFSQDALNLAHQNETDVHEREHVTPYIWKNKNGFLKIGQIYSLNDMSAWRMTVDYKKDYDALVLLEKKVSITSSYLDVITAVEHLDLQQIMNANTKRNEAYNEYNN